MLKALPAHLRKKLAERKRNNAFRSLDAPAKAIDFSSNDYLGFSKASRIEERTKQLLKDYPLQNGATGSRLISGNHPLYGKTERFLKDFHEEEAALIFNSGFDANLGFFSSIPQRNDLIFYDEFAHASIREGIAMSAAKSYKFLHNDLIDLKKKIDRLRKNTSTIYVVTESVFSMDGDSPDLNTLANFCQKNGFFLVIDEAHALGVFGKHGQGLLQDLQLQDKVFARIVTFGKALGAHGAAVLGSKDLCYYLINFARSFIYTTALPPHSIATILAAYQELENTSQIQELQQKIHFFKQQITANNLQAFFTESDSAIQSCILSGNQRVKEISSALMENNFWVKAIVSPTVPKGKERLRFCLHAFNSEEKIKEVLKIITNLKS